MEALVVYCRMFGGGDRSSFEAVLESGLSLWLVWVRLLKARWLCANAY